MDKDVAGEYLEQFFKAFKEGIEWAKKYIKDGGIFDTEKFEEKGSEKESENEE